MEETNIHYQFSSVFTCKRIAITELKLSHYTKVLDYHLFQMFIIISYIKYCKASISHHSLLILTCSLKYEKDIKILLTL